MPPKRREKEVETSKTVKPEPTGDNELFLNAFEKPSQIYRYLRDRSDCKPYFLRRTLYYMQHRRSRKKRPGKKITADSLLEYVLDKPKSDLKTSGYLTLTYLGVFNQRNKSAPKEPVKLETILLKMCHQKRKELCRSVQPVPFGTSYVVFNPPSENPPPKVPTVSIPAENFHLNGSKMKPYTILLRITTNRNEYLMMTSNSSDDMEPKAKRIKLTKESNESAEFGMELVVYDKHQRCSLEDGIYEFVLGELENRGSNDKCARISAPFSTWEDLKEDKEITKQHFDSFENMTKGPTLQFQLKWTKEAMKPIVDRPPQFTTFPENNQSNGENNNVPDVKHPEPTKTIVYQFSCNNKLSSETETTHDLNCPWCFLDCKFVDSLLWHLKLCHPRFNFQFTQMSNILKIDVSVNESYDGSYTGCPTMPFRPGWPMKRSSMTHVIVCHPKRTRTKSLSEFTEIEENDHENHRPYITGHNRLYHHTTTCLPINPKEIDVDSEDEMDPRWLKQKVIMMIDEFTDVNEGEKEVMKMWNLHVMKHGFVGDCQIPLACSMFVDEKGEEILRKNLYRNFVLYMNTLQDFGLISPVTIFHVTQKLQAIIQDNPEINKQLQECWQLQRQHWNAVDQKPVLDVSESAKSPGMSGNQGDVGQRRKPNSEKKPTPKKTSSTTSAVNGKEKKGKPQPEAKRRLSLPAKPELRKKIVKEATGPSAGPSSSGNASTLRRRSVTVESPGSAKKKSDCPS